jgi:glycosyltransferase involved in cell wall biosynthesis
LVVPAAAALQQRASAAAMRIHAVGRPFLRVRAAALLARLTQEQKYDIVHVNEPHALTAAWLGKTHRRTPLLVSRRVGYPISANYFARLRYDAAARIVAISRWSADRVARSGIPESKIAIVYEGIEIPARPTMEQRARARAKYNVPADARLLGCVGVLSPDKGQEWLIRALAELRKKFRSAKLLLAGDGPCRERLQKLAQDAGVSDAVIFAGFVGDVESVYAALDVFLLPSFFEALSNALMSAMAHAIPSIAFNLGGPAEVIEDAKSGLLVEPANAEALCDAIAKILKDPTLAKELSEGARKRIQESFSADKMVEELLRVYRECGA